MGVLLNIDTVLDNHQTITCPLLRNRPHGDARWLIMKDGTCDHNLSIAGELSGDMLLVDRTFRTVDKP